MDPASILTLINLVLPTVTNLIVAIKHRDGTQSAVVYLDEADTQFAANQKVIQDWLASKGKTPAQ